MDTPPDVSAGCREGTEDYTRDIGHDLESQIAEFEQNIETQVGKWAEEMKEKALRADHKLRLNFAELQESLDNIAESRRSLEAAGYPLPDELHEALRRTRQELLDMQLPLDLPQEWVDWVNAQPAFAGLDRVQQQRKSRGAQQRKARAGQRRKHRRR
jgi:hypothetical protein